jgi:hypothetical protein
MPLAWSSAGWIIGLNDLIAAAAAGPTRKLRNPSAVTLAHSPPADSPTRPLSKLR